MAIIVGIIVFCLIIIVYYVVLVSGGKLILWLADGKKKGWSIFMMLPPSGKIWFIVKGSENGPVERFIHSIDRWHQNRNGILEPDTANSKKERGFLRSIGVCLTWPNRYLHERTQVYSVLEQVNVDGVGTDKMVEKKRTGPDTIFDTTISVVVVEAEDLGGGKVNCYATGNIRIRDPIVAEFTKGKFEVNGGSALKTIAADFIGKNNFSDLSKQSHTLPDNTAFFLEFGFDVVSIRLENFQLAGSKDYEAATQSRAIEAMKALAAEETAKGIEKIGNAEANVIERKLRARSSVSNGAEYALADAIQSARTQTLVVGRFDGGIPPIVISPNSALPLPPVVPVAQPQAPTPATVIQTPHNAQMQVTFTPPPQSPPKKRGNKP